MSRRHDLQRDRPVVTIPTTVGGVASRIRDAATERGHSVRFIEMTGHALMSMVEPGEVSPDELQRVGLTDSCLVRVNEQGDIEVRRHDRWDLIGGLLGGFVPRAERASGRTWA